MTVECEASIENIYKKTAAVKVSMGHMMQYAGCSANF